MLKEAPSRYTSISVVVTKAQKDAIEAYRRELVRKLGGRVNFSEAIRDVIDAGIDELRRSGDMMIGTSRTQESES